MLRRDEREGRNKVSEKFLMKKQADRIFSKGLDSSYFISEIHQQPASLYEPRLLYSGASISWGLEDPGGTAPPRVASSYRW